RFLMATAATAIVMVACNNEETDNWAGEIRLSSGLEAQQVTRSINPDLQGGQIADEVEVGFFINENASNPTTTYPQNLLYTANGNGSFDGSTVYYPQSGNGVNIYAYAPWKDGLSLGGNYAFSIQENQSTDEGYLASDLLWGQPMKQKTDDPGVYESANPVARTKENVNVTFKHLLSKIQIELTPEAGLTAKDFRGATLKILNVKNTTSLTLTDGAISEASGSAVEVTAATYENKEGLTEENLKAAAIVVPQTITKGTKFLKVTLKSGGELYYTLPSGADDADLVLESGKIYKYDIKVKLTGLTVTSQITDWETIGEGNPVKGEAVME
uniref:fimbrillin family protein n=1 Tax=Bacteroides cellulosilyticus TaxID=246787 RepID=UPI0032ECA640